MRVRYRDTDVSLLGRLMRSEAVGEGKFGMQLVGNVVVNRVVTSCDTFKNINNIYDAVFQKGQFEGTQTPLFSARATEKEKQMALNVIKYWRADPAYDALYFQNPGKGKNCKTNFWGVFAGRWKNHCFYDPENPEKCGL